MRSSTTLSVGRALSAAVAGQYRGGVGRSSISSNRDSTIDLTQEEVRATTAVVKAESSQPQSESLSARMQSHGRGLMMAASGVGEAIPIKAEVQPLASLSTTPPQVAPSQAAHPHQLRAPGGALLQVSAARSRPPPLMRAHPYSRPRQLASAPRQPSRSGPRVAYPGGLAPDGLPLVLEPVVNRVLDCIRAGRAIDQETARLYPDPRDQRRVAQAALGVTNCNPGVAEHYHVNRMRGVHSQCGTSLVGDPTLLAAAMPRITNHIQAIKHLATMNKEMFALVGGPLPSLLGA